MPFLVRLLSAKALEIIPIAIEINGSQI